MTHKTPMHEMTLPQARFISYTLFVLVDLVVLNLFDEYWSRVTIESFTISLGAAALLQVLVNLTIALGHRIADYIKAKPGRSAKVYRGITTYLILVGSKFVMLEAIDLAFGERVLFGGRWHGLVAFVAVLIAIIVAEAIMKMIYTRFGGRIEA
jgi:hypothetical protein